MMRLLREEWAPYSAGRFAVFKRVYAVRFDENGWAEWEARDIPTCAQIPRRLRERLESLGRLRYCTIYDDDGLLTAPAHLYDVPDSLPGRAFTVYCSNASGFCVGGGQLLIYDRLLDEVIYYGTDGGE